MAEDQHLLTDLRLGFRHQRFRPAYEVVLDRRSLPKKPISVQDLGVVKGRANLGQAVVIRLLTPRGELTALGHPEYGSRLHELIGVLNTDTNRNLARLYILEALQQEPRIETVEELTVEPVLVRHGRVADRVTDRVHVLLRVKPVGITDTITIGPFPLEFAS